MAELWIKKEGGIYFIYKDGHCIECAANLEDVTKIIEKIESEGGDEKEHHKYYLEPFV